jgi:hypothetical protein
MITANKDILRDIKDEPGEPEVPKRSNEELWAQIKKTGIVVKRAAILKDPLPTEIVKLEPVEVSDFVDENEDQDSEDSDFKPAPAKRKRKRVAAKKNAEYIKEIVLGDPTSYTCHKCKAGYPSMDDLYQHMKTGNCFDVEMKCEDCDKVFDNKK